MRKYSLADGEGAVAWGYMGSQEMQQRRAAGGMGAETVAEVQVSGQGRGGGYMGLPGLAGDAAAEAGSGWDGGAGTVAEAQVRGRLGGRCGRGGDRAVQGREL